MSPYSLDLATPVSSRTPATASVKLLALLFAALQLASCGGGSQEAAGASDAKTAEYDQVVALAAKRYQDAIELAVDAPCDRSSQCAVLTLDNGRTCGKTSKDYSLAAPSASAASAAADDYARLSRQADSIVPPAPTTGSCTELLKPPLYCVENKCVRAFIFPPPP